MSEANTLIALSRRLRDVPAKTLPLVPRAVLLFLAARANDDGIAWPRLETLAADAGTSTNTVRRALDWLIAAGWVWVRQSGTPRDSARLEVRLDPAPPPSGPVERYQGSRSVTPGITEREVTERHPRDHAPSSEGSRSVIRGITERGARDHAPSPEDPIEDPKEDPKEEIREREQGSSDPKNRSLDLPLFAGPIPAADATPIPASGVKAKKPRKTTKKPAASEATDVERAVFEGFLRGRRYRRVQGAPPVLDAKRIKLIRDRIHDGHAPETLAAAAEGIWISQWHFDEGHSRFDLALRDGEHIERFDRVKRERDADLARFAPRHDDEPDEEPDFMPPEEDIGPPLLPEHAAAVLERFGLHEGARVIREQAGKQAVNG